MVPYLVHGVHGERVRPEAVVHRHKGQAGAAGGQKKTRTKQNTVTREVEARRKRDTAE